MIFSSRNTKSKPALSLNPVREDIPVLVRRSKQAKRLIIRLDDKTGGIKVTIPPKVNLKAAQKFLDDHRDWVISEHEKRPAFRPIADGDTIYYLGKKHQLKFTKQPPRTVNVTNGIIAIGGPAETAPARLLKFLKDQALEALIARSEKHAKTLGLSYNRLSIGDMRSRWGSCSARGTLKYNWRLIMAPTDILDYVAAHEVSHLREMNHSPEFWQTVAACVPDYTLKRKWLTQYGTALMQTPINPHT